MHFETLAECDASAARFLTKAPRSFVGCLFMEMRLCELLRWQLILSPQLHERQIPMAQRLKEKLEEVRGLRRHLWLAAKEDLEQLEE